MPCKPKKPCAYYGCRELTENRYCDEHAKLTARHYNKYQRDPKSKKRYDADWQKISCAYLSANPLCELCKTDGRLTAATLVHHRRKLSDGGTNDVENLQALCQSCHSRLHARQGDCF